MRKTPLRSLVAHRARHRWSPAATLLFTALLNACGDITGIAPAPAPIRPLASEVEATATTYYVSPNGADRNKGTSPATAWKTLRRASSVKLAAGDRLLFEGGATFSGRLEFDQNDRGTAAAPVVVSSYGTGRAIIDGGSGTAIYIYNTSGLTLRNLTVVGSGRTTNTGSGIDAYTDRAGGALLPYLRIDSVETSGFGRYGVLIGSWNGTAGFSDVRITELSTHDNQLGGLLTYAQTPYVHRNVYVGHVRAYNNSGDPALTNNSGSGIVLGGVSGATIERSLAYNNGWLCTAGEGPVGMFTYDAEQVLIQYNESFNNRTAGPVDGGGFDLDQNTRNTIVQYNYSHGNDGPGFLMAHGPATTNHGNNVVRYNVSENDARRNSAGALSIWGRTIGSEFYHNSVYVAPSASGAPRGIHIYNSGVPSNDVQQVHFRNNAIVTTGGLRSVNVASSQLSGAVDLRFEGNVWFGTTHQPTFAWGASGYTGVSAWRTATAQETLAGLPVGQQGDPGFAAPGAGGTIGNADLLATLSAYKLKAGTLAVDAGINLPQRFGLGVGSGDYWGQTLPWGGAYDVGAHEWR